MNDAGVIILLVAIIVVFGFPFLSWITPGQDPNLSYCELWKSGAKEFVLLSIAFISLWAFIYVLTVFLPA